MARWGVEKGLLRQKRAWGAAICQARAEVPELQGSGIENAWVRTQQRASGDTGGGEEAVAWILALLLRGLIFGKLSSLSFSFLICKMGENQTSLWEDLLKIAIPLLQQQSKGWLEGSVGWSKSLASTRVLGVRAWLYHFLAAQSWGCTYPFCSSVSSPVK